MTYRDDYDKGKALPNSVYMVTSRPHQKSIILFLCFFVFMDTSIPKLVVGLGMAGFNEKEHQNVTCGTYLLHVSHYIIALHYQMVRSGFDISL